MATEVASGACEGLPGRARAPRGEGWGFGVAGGAAGSRTVPAAESPETPLAPQRADPPPSPSTDAGASEPVSGGLDLDAMVEEDYRCPLVGSIASQRLRDAPGVSPRSRPRAPKDTAPGARAHANPPSLRPAQDACYVSSRIIAAPMPTDANVHLVARWLEGETKSNYLLWDLSDEADDHSARTVIWQGLGGRVVRGRLEEEAGPQELTITQVMRNIAAIRCWLEVHQDNRAVICCRNGRVRSGLLIACLLRHAGIFATSFDALEHFYDRRAPEVLRGLERRGKTLREAEPSSSRMLLSNFDVALATSAPPSADRLVLRRVLVHGVPPLPSEAPADAGPGPGPGPGKASVAGSGPESKEAPADADAGPLPPLPTLDVVIGGVRHELSSGAEDDAGVAFDAKARTLEADLSSEGDLPPILDDFAVVSRVPRDGSAASGRRLLFRYANNGAFLSPGTFTLGMEGLDVSRSLARDLAGSFTVELRFAPAEAALPPSASSSSLAPGAEHRASIGSSASAASASVPTHERSSLVAGGRKRRTSVKNSTFARTLEIRNSEIGPEGTRVSLLGADEHGDDASAYSAWYMLKGLVQQRLVGMQELQWRHVVEADAFHVARLVRAGYDEVSSQLGLQLALNRPTHGDAVAQSIMAINGFRLRKKKSVSSLVSRSSDSFLRMRTSDVLASRALRRATAAAGVERAVSFDSAAAAPRRSMEEDAPAARDSLSKLSFRMSALLPPSSPSGSPRARPSLGAIREDGRQMSPVRESEARTKLDAVFADIALQDGVSVDEIRAMVAARRAEKLHLSGQWPPEGTLLRGGALSKRARHGVIGRWQERDFALTDRVLGYHSHKAHPSEERCVFSLEEIRGAAPSAGDPRAFVLSFHQLPAMELRAASPEEAQAWVQTIESAVGQAAEVVFGDNPLMHTREERRQRDRALNRLSGRTLDTLGASQAPLVGHGRGPAEPKAPAPLPYTPSRGRGMPAPPKRYTGAGLRYPSPSPGEAPPYPAAAPTGSRATSPGGESLDSVLSEGAAPRRRESQVTSEAEPKAEGEPHPPAAAEPKDAAAAVAQRGSAKKAAGGDAAALLMAMLRSAGGAEEKMREVEALAAKISANPAAQQAAGALLALLEQNSGPALPEGVEKFAKMLKAGVPRAAVEHKMAAEGADAALLDDPRVRQWLEGGASAASLPELPEAVAKFAKMLKAGVPRAAVELKMAAEGADAALLDAPEVRDWLQLAEGARRSSEPREELLEVPPELLKFAKMLKSGVPRVAVEHKMRIEGVDPGGLDSAAVKQMLRRRSSDQEPDPPAPREPPVDPKLLKYKNMAKAGVPMPAVRNKMVLDGLDPAALDALLGGGGGGGGRGGGGGGVGVGVGPREATARRRRRGGAPWGARRRTTRARRTWAARRAPRCPARGSGGRSRGRRRR